MLVVSCDQDQLGRAAGQDALERVPQILEVVVNCWDDYCDVVGRVLGLFIPGLNRLVSPMTYAVDKKPDITPEPVKVVSLWARGYRAK